MTSFIPITLVGDNLGQRHRHLNTLVDQAYQQNVLFQSIQQLSEHSPIDRLFKIDLASKYRHVEYILYNLKDEDMLYVSRALKSSWLLEPKYVYIMNPNYLEEIMYPEMTTTAVSKLKYWVSLNLNDNQRCQQFFDYYNEKNFDLAIKFLRRCSSEYILSKVRNILGKITPHHLELLSEKCPDVAKIYFESLHDSESVLSNYLKQERQYCNSVKSILKVDADIYLDIIEKYFDQYSCKTLSPEATKYIMSYHKTRFNNKPELYTAWLLDVKTLSKCLNRDEIKDLVLKLATAKYLNMWFSYKNVEPLIKTLSVEERAAFKKQVFVDKSIGDMVVEWPYKPPARPQDKTSGMNIFQDKDHDPRKYEALIYTGFACDTMRMRRKCAAECDMMCANRMLIQSPLDQLFDRYRFTSFEKTFFELRKKMAVENLQNRQNMMLVLVSKSGGRPESVEQLLRLLMERHENEPVHLRATVIRSLIKRCSAWRLSQNIWELILSFGRDLGLDGRPPAASCLEGLHAVVLRNMLLDRDCDSVVWDAFLKSFSYFKEYSLTATERRTVSYKLPALLLSDIEANPSNACQRVNQLLDTLLAYNIQADECPGVISVIKATVHRDPNAEPLLLRLFSTGIARKELFKEYFSVIKTGPSYFNALKQDISVLESGNKLEELLQSGNLQHDRFLRALALYFSEPNGLAVKYFSVLEKVAMKSRGEFEAISKSDDDQHCQFSPVMKLCFDKNVRSRPNNQIARALTILAGGKLISILQKLDESPNHSKPRRLAVALRANAHLSRPLIDLNAIGWQSIGVKAVANRVLKCSDVNVEFAIEKLLSWKRTQRLALVLSMRKSKECIVTATVAAKRPRLALKTVLWHLRRTNTLDSRIWDIIIPLIGKLDVSGKLSERLRKALGNVSVVPPNRKPEYCAIVFDVLKNISREEAMPMLCHIECILCDIDDGRFIEIVIQDFLDNDFTEENVSKSEYNFQKRTKLYVRVISKFLHLAKNETILTDRFKNVGHPFLDKIRKFWDKIEDKSHLTKYLNTFIHSLKFSKVFLNTEYVSSMWLFENVINEMQKFLPVELYFNKYVQIHLTMLYCKSIKQGMKNNPEIFENLSSRIKEGVEVVGTAFGKYIAHEIKELKAKYFDSIIDLYKIELLQYLNNYFEYDVTRVEFKVSIIKGILRSEESTHLLAQYMYSQEEYNIKDCVGEQIHDLLNKSESQEVKFFLYA